MLEHWSNKMEVFTLLLASEYGLAALSPVTLAVSMLVGTFSLLVYQASKPVAIPNYHPRNPG